MTQAFKLEVNIHESNGLTMVINDVLIKVKHNTLCEYKLHPSKQVECILHFNNQESSAIFLEYVSELAYNPYITILLCF